jgi:ubiquinone/menaquinone biosynthesis C-methylase UbiE
MCDLTNAIIGDWRHHSWSVGLIGLEKRHGLSTYFDQLDTDGTLELACGHSRHAAQIIDKVKHLTLVDANQENITRRRSRLASLSP